MIMFAWPHNNFQICSQNQRNNHNMVYPNTWQTVVNDEWDTSHKAT